MKREMWLIVSKAGGIAAAFDKESECWAYLLRGEPETVRWHMEHYERGDWAIVKRTVEIPGADAAKNWLGLR